MFALVCHSLKHPTFTFISFLFFLPLTLFSAESKDRTLTYIILQNENQVGKMNFREKLSGQDVSFEIVSQASVRLVLKTDIKTRDESYFSKGKLIYSNVYRYVNGKEKESKQTRLQDQSYLLKPANKIVSFKFPVNYNMMMLYTREPVNISQVFSDNLQQFLPIRKLGEHSYRVDLVNGRYNEYYYKDGICERVVLQHSLFSITMQLV